MVKVKTFGEQYGGNIEEHGNLMGFGFCIWKVFRNWHWKWWKYKEEKKKVEIWRGKKGGNIKKKKGGNNGGNMIRHCRNTGGIFRVLKNSLGILKKILVEFVHIF